MPLTAGVVTATVVAVTSSVWLARSFTLSDEIQRSLRRSVTTPFRCRAQNPRAGSRIWWRVPWSSLACLAWLPRYAIFGVSIREGTAKGRIRRGVTWAGTARSYELLVSRRASSPVCNDAVRRGDGAGSPAGGEGDSLIFLRPTGPMVPAHNAHAPCCTPNPVWER